MAEKKDGVGVVGTMDAGADSGRNCAGEYEVE
jgi:hypothetical protein